MLADKSGGAATREPDAVTAGEVRAVAAQLRTLGTDGAVSAEAQHLLKRLTAFAESLPGTKSHMKCV